LWGCIADRLASPYSLFVVHVSLCFLLSTTVELNVIPRLQTEVLCRGSPAYQAVASPVRLMSVAQSVYFVTNLLSTVYVDPTGASS